MRKLFTVLMVMCAIPVIGQKHSMGIQSGVNVTNVKSDNFVSNDDNRIGFIGGLTYGYQLNSSINFGVDLLYSQKGFISDMIFTDELGNPTGEKDDVEFNYDYLSIPVKGGFLVGNKISGFFNLGIVPSFLINAEYVMPPISDVIEESVINVTSDVNTLDFGGLVEIGGNYNAGDRFMVFASMSYQQSFTSLTSDDYFRDSEASHYGINLSVGLKYVFKSQ